MHEDDGVLARFEVINELARLIFDLAAKQYGNEHQQGMMKAATSLLNTSYEEVERIKRERYEAEQRKAGDDA